MTVIHVPRPPKKAMDPQRPVSALLKTQIEHLQQAELRLPLQYQTSIYVNAIKTEGEAADYIGSVTEALHKAHQDAAAKHGKVVRRQKRVLEIAAAAQKKRSPKSKSSSSKKKSRARQKSRRNKSGKR